MIKQTRSDARARLKRFAKSVILDADTFFSMIENNPNFRDAPLMGPLDPEDWTLMRHNAQKILAAIETDGYINRAWVDNIARAAAHGADDA